MEITSTVKYLGDLSTECTHLKSNSVIVTDAPTDNNGKGLKFSPTDTVATGLVSCMITVMGIKARESEIKFNDIRAEVTKMMGSNPRRISEIRVKILIEESWSSREKTIMENTAKTCPVAKSLHPDVVQKIEFIYTKEIIS